MKKLLMQVLSQISICSILIYIVIFWAPHFALDERAMLLEFAIGVLLATLVGLILGDFSFYKHKKLHYKAIFVSAILCVCGILFSVYLIDVVKNVFTERILGLAVVVIPAAISYNLIIYRN